MFSNSGGINSTDLSKSLVSNGTKSSKVGISTVSGNSCEVLKSSKLSVITVAVESSNSQLS